MNPHLVRYVLSPLHERLMGRHTFARLRAMEDHQWRSPRRIREDQSKKLRKLLRIARDNCRYYRNQFTDRGINIDTADPFEALAALPLLTKTAIRANLGELTNHRVRGGLIPMNTGGSTGEPLVFNVDRRRIAHDKAARMLTHRWYGAEPGEREVYLWGSPLELRAQDRVKAWRDRITNELLLDAFNLTPSSMRRYLDQIAEFDPVSIFGYPSSLATLAAYGESTGTRMSCPSLRAVFTTGEWLAPHDRRALRRFFRAPIANGYGSRDGGFIAHECPEGGMHIVEDGVIVEIVDDAGMPVEPGESGEIVITHLEAWATPLLRYRTGDIGRREDGPCACGRTWRQIGVVEGRRTDHLVAANGALQHALSAIYVVRELATVRQFQIRQDEERNVCVSVVPDTGFADSDAEHIRTGLRRRLGADLDVRIQLVDRIATEKSGKFRCVVSDAASRSNIGRTTEKEPEAELTV
ncbi:MAG: phenylacetate--CoA ligase family protein [Phycisphaerales bacterium]|nr:phenylacetate--CoA ligase family protein [Phycisphaerales bacterium]